MTGNSEIRRLPYEIAQLGWLAHDACGTQGLKYSALQSSRLFAGCDEIFLNDRGRKGGAEDDWKSANLCIPQREPRRPLRLKADPPLVPGCGFAALRFWR